jgi:hypothetical protein
MNEAMLIFNKWLSMVDFPATVLLVMVIMGAYVMYKTQKNPHNDFDFADMLRDENGKPSAIRLAIFPCLAISSWVIMYLVVQNKAIDLWLIVFYMCVWSGAKIAEKMVDAYAATKGAAMPVSNPLQAVEAAKTVVSSEPPPAAMPTTFTGAAGLVLPLPKTSK